MKTTLARLVEIEREMLVIEKRVQENIANERVYEVMLFELNREYRRLQENANKEEFDNFNKKFFSEYKELDTVERGNNDYLRRRDAYVDRYMNFAKRYMDLPPKRYNNSNVDSCEQCGSIAWDVYHDNGPVCTACGFSRDVLDGFSSCKDGKTTKTNKNNTMNKHLYDAINQIECKQRKDIHVSVYDKIRREMEKKGITTETLTKTKLHKILQYIGYTDYHDVHKIHHDITGEQPLDLSNWTAEIMQDHMEYQQMYDRIKPEEKSNSQNKIYKLLRLCMRRDGFAPKKDDWFMIEEKIDLYETDARLIFEKLGWEYTEIRFVDFE